MAFRFNNYARRIGTRGQYQWYEWLVFMDEPAEVLDQVERVEYRLHKTFPQPIRLVENRRSRFALKSSGWGEFWVFITIYLVGGGEEYEKYYLDLSKPWPGEG